MTAAVASELTCQELVELVTDYFEDRLTVAQNTRLELHVCSCTGCRVYLGQMRALVRASGRLCERDVAAGVNARLLSIFRRWKRGDAT